MTNANNSCLTVRNSEGPHALTAVIDRIMLLCTWSSFEMMLEYERQGIWMHIIKFFGYLKTIGVLQNVHVKVSVHLALEGSHFSSVMDNGIVFLPDPS